MRFIYDLQTQTELQIIWLTFKPLTVTVTVTLYDSGCIPHLNVAPSCYCYSCCYYS